MEGLHQDQIPRGWILQGHECLTGIRESASALVRQETEDRIQNPGIVVCSCYEWGSPLKPQEGLTRPIAKATTWLSALSGVFTHCREAQGLVWADKGHHVHLSKRAEWLTCLCYCTGLQIILSHSSSQKLEFLKLRPAHVFWPFWPTLWNQGCISTSTHLAEETGSDSFCTQGCVS